MTEIILIVALVAMAIAVRGAYRRGIRHERDRCREIIARTVGRLDLGALSKSERDRVIELPGFVGTGASLDDFERIYATPRPNPALRVRMTPAGSRPS